MANAANKPWLPTQNPEEVVLKNVKIILAEEGKVIEGNLHLRAGKVTQRTEGPAIATPTTVKHIDLEGKYVCPGLIDCHVHLSAAPGSGSMRDLYAAHPETIAYRTAFNAKQMLLRGFTTARDTGGATYALRDAIAENLVVGPRLFIAGKAISQTGGHGDLRAAHEDASFKCCGGNVPGLARVCDGVPACLEAARDELRQGADFLKIMVGGGVSSPSDPLEMVQFTPEEIQAITTSARQLNRIVTAHAYTCEAIRHAVENGVMAIEHANFVDKPTAKLLAEKGISVIPTLAVYQKLISPPYDQFLLESGRKKSQQVIASGVESLKILREAGVNVCFGTDFLTGMHIHQNEEFAIRAKILSSDEILRHATCNAAKLLKMEGKIGTLEEGAFADLLILDQNPLEDIDGVLGNMGQHCLAIMKEGRVIMSKIEELKKDTLYS